MPCAFLLVYVLGYSAPTTAIAPHLELAGLPPLAIFLTRLALDRSSAGPGVHFSVTSTLTSGAMALLVVCYTVVLIGLHSWGGGVAWNVVPTFFLKTSLVTEVWKIPRLCFTAVPILEYWWAIALCRRYFDRVFDLGVDPREDRDLRDQVPAERQQDWRERLETGMGTSLPVPVRTAERDENAT